MRARRHDGSRGRHTVVMVIALLWLLTGCGATQAAGASPPRPTATGAVPGDAALNGCASQSPPAATPAADLTLRDGAGAQFQRVSVRPGQIIAVSLRADIRWHLTPLNPSGVLAPLADQSAYAGADQRCVWRFAAAGAGTVALSFSGGLVCPDGQACPAIAAIQSFTITVAG